MYALLLLLLSSHEQAATVVSPSLPVLGGLQLGAVLMLAPAVLGGVMVFRPRVRLLFAYSLLTILPMFILIVAAIACAAVSEEKTVSYARVVGVVTFK